MHELVGRGTLTGATLSKPRRSDPARARRVTIRPVLLRGELRYGWTYHEPSRATNENLTADETERRLVHVLGGEFRQGLAPRSGRGLPDPRRREGARGGRPRARRRRSSTTAGSGISSRTACPSRSSSSWASCRRRARCSPAATASSARSTASWSWSRTSFPPSRTGRCAPSTSARGKSYLTFALHHFLRAGHGREVEILGLDLKEDVVARCEALARRLGAVGLRFEVGDIAGHAGARAPRPGREPARLRHGDRRCARPRRAVGGCGDPRRAVLSARAVAAGGERVAGAASPPRCSPRAVRRGRDRCGAGAAPRARGLRRAAGRVRRD